MLADCNEIMTTLSNVFISLKEIFFFKKFNFSLHQVHLCAEKL